MALNRRRLDILKIIRENGYAKVQDLSRIFNVTEVTIRQDLDTLDKEGLIRREHGGAFTNEVSSYARTFKELSQSHIREKQELAAKAVALIKEGDIIILDSGSTTTEIAKLLVGFRKLNVITNSVNIALLLGSNPEINLIVTGGDFNTSTLSLSGSLAASAFNGLHVDKLFLATAGISNDMQLTYPCFDDITVKQAMIQSAEKIYLVADSSKIGSRSFATLGPVTVVNTLICDDNISAEAVAKFEQIHINVL